MPAFLDINDNCVNLFDLYDSVSAAYVNDATVTTTIKDATGATIISDQSMSYVAASNGHYRAIIPASTDLGGDGSVVTVEVDATGSDGSVYHAIGTATVKGRGFSGR